MRVRGIALTSSILATVAVAAVPALAQSPQPQPQPAEPTGVWIDHTGRGAVEITPCGDALCGRVVWIKDTGNTKACGVQILGEVKPAGAGVWGKGWIYDPEEDSKFDVELKPLAGDKLRVVGYLGTKLFSETMTWKRAPADLQRCDAKEQTAATAPTPATPDQPAPPPAAALPQAAPAPAVTPEAPKEAQTQAEAIEPSTTAPKEVPPAAKAAPPKPSRQANARSENCKVELPWFSVKFPCPD